MDSVSRGEQTAGSLPHVAAEILADLRASSPDVGDDETQVMLDDVLLTLEARLGALAGSTE